MYLAPKLATNQRYRRVKVAELSDELLMAYADNEMEPAELQRVALILATRPELMEKVRRFERTRGPVQRAFDGVSNGPLPAVLLERSRRPATEPVSLAEFAVQRAARQTSGGSASGVAIGKSAFASFWQPIALAASLGGLLIGGVAGYSVRSFDTAAPVASSIARLPTGLRADGAIQVALENTASNAVYAAGPDTFGVKPVATFLSRDQRFCRQYELTSGATAQFEGVACRTSAGTWDVVFHAQAVKPAVAGSGKIAPAAPNSSNAVGSAVDRLIDGGTFDPHEEQRVLADKWKR
jgi:anti-sigma factor RsiW